MRNRKQDLIVKLMECGRLSPLDGYRRLKKNFAAMTACERTTDHCRAMIDLEEHDATTFMERIIRG